MLPKHQQHRKHREQVGRKPADKPGLDLDPARIASSKASHALTSSIGKGMAGNVVTFYSSTKLLFFCKEQIMARKFIVVSGLEAGDMLKCFSMSGKAPRANICPRFGSFQEAQQDAQKWVESGYCASILRPIKGGGWGEVAFVERDR